jgi:hypothetical protein
LEINGRPPVIDQCDRIIAAGHKTIDAPRRVDSSEKVSGSVRLQIYIKAIKWDLKTPAAGFDVSLFAGPT